MATLRQLKRGVRELSDVELKNLLLEIRQRRRTPPPPSKRKATKAAKSKVSVDKLIDRMTPEQIEQFLKKHGS